MKYLCLLLIALNLCACSEPSAFPVQLSLSGKSLELKDSLNKTTRLYCSGDQLLMKDYNGSHFILSYNLSSKTFFRFVEMGEAPTEALSVQTMGINKNLFYIFDTGNQCFKMFDLRSGKFISSTERIKQCVNLFARPLCDSLFVGCPYADSLRVVQFDRTGTVVAKNSQYPFRDTFDPSYAHTFSTMSDIAVHPTQKKFAMATQYASGLQIFEFGNQELRLVSEKEMEAPQYDIINNSFAVNDKTQWGYLSITRDDRFLYLLYSGAVQKDVTNPCIGNTIHIFDWEGNAVAELKVQEMLTDICVDNQKLYAIQLDSTYGYEIMEYDLPSWE